MLSDLTLLIPNRSLTGQEIGEAAKALLDRSVSDDDKAAFLAAWAKRGETATELADCAEAFLPQALKPGVSGSWKGKALLDCCGTGGGGLNLINISTGVMFILGALGIPVVKHGNRGITKKSGSADVLETLGIKIDLAPDQVVNCLEEVGCAFLFAPAYHPTFAVIGPVRRSLAAQGQRTIFNLLGPLLNPARPDARMVGVFKEEHLDLYHRALLEMGCKRFDVVCGEDDESHKKIGEASASGITTISSNLSFDPNPSIPTKRGASILRIDAKNSPFGENLDSLLVTDATDSARRLQALFSNEEKGLAREMLLLNTAIAAWTQGAVADIAEGHTQAAEALDSGRARECLKRWQKFSSRF